MEYLFGKWDYIKKILQGEYLLIFCDYDGTLAPIAETPDEAVITNGIKELVNKLSQTSDCRIVIISGRTIKDIRGKVRLKNVIYAGNHGLEISGCGFRFKAQVLRRYRNVLRTIKNNLASRLLCISGVLLEDKGISVSVHYRLVSGEDVPSVKAIVGDVVLSYMENEEVKVKHGKKVIEIMPPIEWDKGKAALWILKKQRGLLKKKRILPVYFGDDITDEDAFDVLRNKGITVFVGKSKVSRARYYLKNTEEVTKILQDILTDADRNVIHCLGKV